MSGIEESINRYTSGILRDRVFAALRGAGLDPAAFDAAALREADQFHTGGLEATRFVASALGVRAGTSLLDVGSGLGGPARYFASLGAQVTGVDVTPEFVELARQLNISCALDSRVSMLLRPGHDTALPAQSFDAAVMLHVGMNLSDKPAVFAEVFRLLRPGASFGIYDLLGSNELSFPMPWAEHAGVSYVESGQAYAHYLNDAGFDVTSQISRTEEVLAFMGQVRRAMATGDDPLAAPMVLQGDGPALMKNLGAAIAAKTLEPLWLLATKPADAHH